MKLPIDCSNLRIFFEHIEPDLDFKTKELIIVDGSPRYLVSCRVFSNDPNETPEGIKVKIALPRPISIPIFSPITFEGLRISHWSVQGRSGYTFFADSIRVLQSTKKDA